MSVKKITYNDKEYIRNDPNYSREQTITDDDMNEIKKVVNNNADEVTGMQENIEDLQEGQGTSDTDITNLKNRVTTLEKDNTENKSNISSLQEQFSNFENYDDTEIKQDISEIKQEQQTQNSDIENLQTNDSKQDELISKLKNVALNAETEESKSIHVEDANKFGQLEVLGNHEQKTRDGYNILPNNLTNTTINGVTFTINEDKSVTVNGTATASIIANLITGEYNDNNATEPLIIPDNITNCRLSGCPSGGSSSTYKLDIYNQKYALLATDWGEGTNVTIDSQEDKKIARVRIIIYSGATVNNLTFKPMLVAGTEEKEYEQYGASPSPDYPSEVVCLEGSTEIKKDNGLHNIQVEQGSLNSSTGTIIDADTRLRTADFVEIKNFNKIDCKGMTTCNVFFYDTNKTYLGRASTSWETLPFQFEILQNAVYLKAIFRKDDEVVTPDMTKNLRLYSEEVDYLLYIQQEMLPGDYFIKEAAGWKEVHSYPKKIFDGTETWNLESLSQGNNFYTNISDALGDTTAPVYSNCFMYYNGLLDKNYSCRISGSKNLNLRCNEKNTAEEFKQMLADKYNAGNPVYAFYKSAIPTKLACTPEQSAVLEELNNLDLYKPVTNIITTEDIALLKLKYSLDVKSYVDNKISSLTTQTTETTQEETI